MKNSQVLNVDLSNKKEIEEALKKLYVMFKIKQGVSQIDSGDFVPHEKLLKSI